MAAVIQIKRTPTADNAPPAGLLAEGELAVEMASLAPRLWVGVPVAADATQRRLIIDASLYLPLGGGTLSGPLVLAADPAAPMQAVTQQWITNNYAPIRNPAFVGNPTAPTPPPGDASLRLATTAFVNAALAGEGTITGVVAGPGLYGGGTTGTVTLSLAIPVLIANGGTGASSAAAALANLGGAPLASPAFTGTPTAPSPAAADNSTRLATTAYVQAQGYGDIAGVTAGTGLTGGGTTGTVTLNLATPVAVALGGTGLTGGTAGGIPYFSAAGAALASSGTLTGNALVVGGGSGAAPGPRTGWTIAANNSPLIGNFSGAAAPAIIGAAGLQLVGSGASGVQLNAFAATSSVALIRADGTPAAPATIGAAERLAGILAYGYDGAAYQQTAAITFEARQAFTSTVRGTGLTFWGTPVGSTAITALMQLGVTGGGLAMPGSVAGLDLGVGTINVSGAYYIGGAPVTDPAWTFGFGGAHNLSGNLNAAAAPAMIFNGLQIATADTLNAGLAIRSFAGNPTLAMTRADGTGAAPSGVLSGDIIGTWLNRGYTSAGAYSGNVGYIQFAAAENFTATANGTRINFVTTPAGGTTQLGSLTIENNGGLIVPSSVAGGSKGSGTINVSSGYYIGGNSIFASPALTGTPTAPTAAPGDNSTILATTAFVAASTAASVTSFNTRTGAVTLAAADVTGVGGALLASPAFTGTPSAPTPATADNSTSLATTAYVQAQGYGDIAGVTAGTGLTGGGTAGVVTLNLATPVAVALGGTGLTGGTSGGVPYYSAAGTLASSAALSANALIIGGGPGAAPVAAQHASLTGGAGGNVINLNMSATAAPGAFAAGFQATGNDAGGSTGFECDTWGTSATIYFHGRLAGGTNAAPTAVVANQTVRYMLAGWDGTAYRPNAAAIDLITDETWSATARGTKIVFWTTKDTTLTTTANMVLANDGGLMLPTGVAGGSKGPGTVNASSGYYIGTVAMSLTSTLLRFNSTTAAIALPGVGGSPGVQLAGADNGPPTFINDAFGTGVGYYINRQTGGTSAAPAATAAGQTMGRWVARGYDTNWLTADSTRIESVATETFSTTGRGGRLNFWTNQTGTTTLGSRLTIENDGGLLVPATVTGGSLGPGTINVTGGYYVNGVLLGAGSPSAGTVGQIQSSAGGGAFAASDWTIANGLITAHNTVSNMIVWPSNGVNPPAFTTRSVGTRLVLWPGVSGTGVDYAIGIASGAMWYSVQGTINQFAWYGGITVAATLSGTGTLTLVGNLATANMAIPTTNPPTAGTIFAGGSGVIASAAPFNMNVYANIYYDGTNSRYLTAGAGAAFVVANNGTFFWTTAPSGAAGAVAIGVTTMSLDASGNLNLIGSLTQTIASGNGVHNINMQAAGTSFALYAYRNGSARMGVVLMDTAAESGGNAGSNLAIARYNDSSAFIDYPLYIYRSSGIVQFSAGFTFSNWFGGNFQIGADATNGWVRLQVNAADWGYLVRGHNGNGAYVTALSSNSAGTAVAFTLGSGAVSIVSTTPSDRALKSNLAACEFDALGMIERLPIYSADLRNLDHSTTHWHCSLIADEVEAVLPEAYQPPPGEGMYAGLHPLPLITTLFRATQQLAARVAELERGR